MQTPETPGHFPGLLRSPLHAHSEQTRALLRAAASLLIIGFPGQDVSPEVRELLALGVGGVILFKRNIADPHQVADLIEALQGWRAGPLPLLMSVDQEGGRVARLKAPLTELPDMANLGRLGDITLAEGVGRILADELLALGFNLDFAPVMDVDSNPDNPVIGPRALSTHPLEVARLGTALIDAMQTRGLLACAKHFPGHGDTHTDSHLELPELPHSLERLRSVELVPFVAAIAARVATIMTAHVRFQALDPAVPATLSRRVMHGLLRQELGFEGVIISDDLEMKAVLDHFGVAESARRGLEAGVDAFLVCHEASRQGEALEALVRAAESSLEQRDRLLEAAARVEALRKRVRPHLRPSPEALSRLLGQPAHQDIARRLREGEPSRVQV